MSLEQFTDFNIQTLLGAERVAARGLAILGSCSDVTTKATAAGTDEAALAATPGLRITGFFLQETVGSATATVIIRHGTANSDPPLGGALLAAGACFNHTFPGGGIPCPNGVWIDRSGTGSAAVTVYTKTVVVTT